MPFVKSRGEVATPPARRPSSMEWGNGVGMIKLNPLSRLSPSIPSPPPPPRPPASLPATPLSSYPLDSPSETGWLDSSLTSSETPRPRSEMGLFSGRNSIATSTETLNNGGPEPCINNEMYDSGISLSAISPKIECVDGVNKVMVQSMSSDSGWTIAGSETDGDQNIELLGDVPITSPYYTSLKNKGKQEEAICPVEKPEYLASYPAENPENVAVCPAENPEYLAVRPPGITGLNLRVSATPPRDTVPRSRSEPLKLAQLGDCSLKESSSLQEGVFVKPMLPIKISGPPTLKPSKQKRVLPLALLDKVTDYVHCQSNGLNFEGENVNPRCSSPFQNQVLGDLPMPMGKRYTKLHMPGSRLPELIDSFSESDMESEHDDVSTPIGISDHVLSQQDCLDLSWDDHDLSAFIPEVPDGYSCFKPGQFQDLDLGDPSHSSTRSSSVSPEAAGQLDLSVNGLHCGRHSACGRRRRREKTAQKCRCFTQPTVTLASDLHILDQDAVQCGNRNKTEVAAITKSGDSASEVEASGLHSDSFVCSDQAEQNGKKPNKKAAKKRKRKKKKDGDQEDDGGDEGTQKSKKPKKVPPNYFVAIQVSDPQIGGSLGKVQRSVTDNKPGLTPALIPLPTLHLTLYVTHLEHSEQIDRAKAALDACYEKLRHMEDSPVDLTVSGLGNFRNNVVFAKVQPGAELDRLNHIAEVVCECFAEQNVLPSDNKGFKPHCTIMKLSRSPKLKKKGITKIDPEFYRHHEEELFGHQRIQSLQLCSMFKPKNEDGYYHVEYAVPLFKKGVNSGPSSSPPSLPNTSETPQADLVLEPKVEESTPEVEGMQQDEKHSVGSDLPEGVTIEDQIGAYHIELSSPIKWNFHSADGCYGKPAAASDQSKSDLSLEESRQLSPTQVLVMDASLPEPEVYVVKVVPNLQWNVQHIDNTLAMDATRESQQ